MSPARRAEVLWLAKGLGPGGMERLLVNHARFGDHDRFRYIAAYLVERPGSVVPELEGHRVECIRLGDGRSADPRWLWALRRLVRERRIDIVHAHSPLPAAMARPALRAIRHRPRLVYTEHNTWDCYGTATRIANLVTYPLDDAQLAVSRDAAASPPTCLAQRLEVLTHGIDLEQVRAASQHRDAIRSELGIDAATTVVTTVANLRVEKAYDVLLDAARAVADRRSDVVFLSVGHGSLEDELRRRAATLDLGDRFRFLGFRSDALRVLGGSDVFVLASRQEGLPVSYMEATAIGLPVVVTSVGGLPDFVEDGSNGLVVPPERPDLLADAIERVVSDPALRERLSTASLATSDRFDARTAVRRQEELYVGLIR